MCSLFSANSEQITITCMTCVAKRYIFLMLHIYSELFSICDCNRLRHDVVVNVKRCAISTLQTLNEDSSSIAKLVLFPSSILADGFSSDTRLFCILHVHTNYGESARSALLYVLPYILYITILIKSHSFMHL